MTDVIQYSGNPFLFAEDIEISHQIMCTQYCKDIQEDIKTMQLWSEKWLLCGHPDKCKYMRTGNRDIALYAYELKDDGKAMEFVFKVRDKNIY